MSFEGYYQCVCKNGHYFEINAYDDRDKCVDCYQDIVMKNIVDETNCEQYGYVRIPVDKSFNVDKEFFKRYFASEEKISYFYLRNKRLIHLYNLQYAKEYFRLEKIIDLFQYFDKNKTLKIEFKTKKDSNEKLVPFVSVSFGSIDCDVDSVEYGQWKELSVNEYGQESNSKESYKCLETGYDTDVYTVVFELYKNMWNRCFNPRFNEKKDLEI